MFLWCVRDGCRDIYSERWLLLPISSSRSQGMPAHAPPCKLVRDDLIGCVSLARLRFSALCLNLTAWFSSRGLLPVTHLLYPSALIALLFTNQNVTAWQSTRVTRKEPKIHVICYITFVKVRHLLDINPVNWAIFFGSHLRELNPTLKQLLYSITVRRQR